MHPKIDSEKTPTPIPKRKKSTPLKPKAGAKRKVKPRIGDDGQPEAVTAVMDHAPVHPVFVFTNGLFRPIQNGSRQSGTHVGGKYTSGKSTVHCHWDSDEALDITDQSVLFYLCQLGAMKKRTMQLDMKDWDTVNADNKPTAPKDKRRVAKLMQLAGSGQYLPLVAITTTAAEIAKGIGLSSTGTNSKTVLNSLERLSKTKMTRTVRNPSDASANGIGLTTVICMVAQANRKIAIALNAELSSRCTNHKGVVWINMQEQRALESKPAKRLHAWLSAWACQYNKKAIGMEMLPRHIYGPPKGTASAIHSRLDTARSAVREIAELPGWHFGVNIKSDQLKVRKPLFVGTDAEAAFTAVPIAITEKKSL
jgi:hypothetical protein